MKTKSADLLARGYELIDGITVPVGTSNVDLDVEGEITMDDLFFH